MVVSPARERSILGGERRRGERRRGLPWSDPAGIRSRHPSEMHTRDSHHRSIGTGGARQRSSGSPTGSSRTSRSSSGWQRPIQAGRWCALPGWRASWPARSLCLQVSTSRCAPRGSCSSASSRWRGVRSRAGPKVRTRARPDLREPRNRSRGGAASGERDDAHSRARGRRPMPVKSWVSHRLGSALPCRRRSPRRSPLPWGAAAVASVARLGGDGGDRRFRGDRGCGGPRRGRGSGPVHRPDVVAIGFPTARDLRGGCRGHVRDRARSRGLGAPLIREGRSEKGSEEDPRRAQL